jgi:hypothetical protein
MKQGFSHAGLLFQVRQKCIQRKCGRAVICRRERRATKVRSSKSPWSAADIGISSRQALCECQHQRTVSKLLMIVVPLSMRSPWDQLTACGARTSDRRRELVTIVAFLQPAWKATVGKAPCKPVGNDLVQTTWSKRLGPNDLVQTNWPK